MNDKDLQREYEQIGARIRNARIEQKMSQADLAAKQEFIDTIALCPNWTLVDFYVDEGQTAPYMENAK